MQHRTSKGPGPANHPSTYERIAAIGGFGVRGGGWLNGLHVIRRQKAGRRAVVRAKHFVAKNNNNTK
jgi:hypothetical protein